MICSYNGIEQLLVTLHIRSLHIVQNYIRRRASSRAEIGGSRTCRRDGANPTSSTRVMIHLMKYAVVNLT